MATLTKTVLVSTDWAEDHLTQDGFRFVEVDVDTSAYDQGHAPRAVGWNWQTQLQDAPRRDIASQEAFERLLSQAGITPDTTIVLYGDNNNWFAAFAYWLLKVYGHEDVVLINGGRKKWLAEHRPVTTEAPQHAATAYKFTNPNASLRALSKDALAHLNQADAALVDVRSPDEFAGRVLGPPGLNEGAQRGGHIPGAANIPWSQAVEEDGTFKSETALRALYEGQGISPDKDVVTYCRIGERSAHTWFVLHELLGYEKVRNYDGSWTEWGNIIGVPIETGN